MAASDNSKACATEPAMHSMGATGEQELLVPGASAQAGDLESGGCASRGQQWMPAGRWWRVAAGAITIAGVMLLVLGGRPAGAAAREGPRPREGADAGAGALESFVLEEWEALPNMSHIIKAARQLQETELDEVYRQPPENIAYCVVDVTQSMAFLGQAVTFLYKAINSGYPGGPCKLTDPVACGASIAGYVTALAWVSAYTSLAASDCAATVNKKALCSADWSAITAAFGELAFASTAASSDCDFSLDPRVFLPKAVDEDAAASAPATAAPEVDLTAPGGKLKAVALQLQKMREKVAALRAQQQALVQGRVQSTVDLVTTIDAAKRAELDRNFDIAQCTFDVVQATSRVVRVILQIRDAATQCADPRACEIDVLKIIWSFGWIAQFTSLAVTDCPRKPNQRAACAADISDLVAGCAQIPAAALSIKNDCADS